MIRIKSLGVPPEGAHWSMGADYMQRISKASAAKLCAPQPLPAIGYERDISTRKREGFFAGADHLTVQNMSGDFYLASASAKVAQWPDVFGVDCKP